MKKIKRNTLWRTTPLNVPYQIIHVTKNNVYFCYPISITSFDYYKMDKKEWIEKMKIDNDYKFLIKKYPKKLIKKIIFNNPSEKKGEK